MTKSKFSKIVSEIFFYGISIGPGVYVGYYEAKGHRFDPTFKYAILSAPTALTASIVAPASVFLYLMKKMMKKEGNSREAIEKAVIKKYPLLRGVNLEEKITAFQEVSRKAVDSLERTVPNKRAIAKTTAKSMGITALKTGAGYVAGYILGSF